MHTHCTHTHTHTADSWMSFLEIAVLSLEENWADPSHPSFNQGGKRLSSHTSSQASRTSSPAYSTDRGVCVCVCVRARARERERERDIQRERDCLCLCVCPLTSTCVSARNTLRVSHTHIHTTPDEVVSLGTYKGSERVASLKLDPKPPVGAHHERERERARARARARVASLKLDQKPPVGAHHVCVCVCV